MQTTINFINEKTNNFKPEVGIILGSGLGDFAKEFTSIKIPYTEIPDFGTSNVQGHAGQLIFTEIPKNIGNKEIQNAEHLNVLIMQGRYHFYECNSMDKVVYPIKVMKKLGVKTLIITNAAGAINKSLKPADLMIITDHINLMGTNPLLGKNDESLGTRFPDMSEVYKKDLIRIAEKSAKKAGIKVKKGIYAGLSGPSYETPAEVKMLKTLGADVAGMSTVPEAIVANYCGINILGISCISNYASGVQKKPLSHDEVIKVTDIAQNKFRTFILSFLEDI